MWPLMATGGLALSKNLGKGKEWFKLKPEKDCRESTKVSPTSAVTSLKRQTQEDASVFGL